MVAGMATGSVIVDLAAGVRRQRRGRAAGRGVSSTAIGGAVRLLGMKDAPSTMPVDASRLYAKNVANLLLLMTKDGEVVPTSTTRSSRARASPTTAWSGTSRPQRCSRW
jgi:NAD(P) transhydrogenase subunit alpha